MELLIKYEIFAFFVLPFLLGILHRRGTITARQVSLTIATNLSLIMGTVYLSLGDPKSLFSLPLEDWLVAIAVSLICWVITFAIVQSFYKL